MISSYMNNLEKNDTELLRLFSGFVFQNLSNKTNARALTGIQSTGLILSCECYIMSVTKNHTLLKRFHTQYPDAIYFRVKILVFICIIIRQALCTLCQLLGSVHIMPIKYLWNNETTCTFVLNLVAIAEFPSMAIWSLYVRTEIAQLHSPPRPHRTPPAPAVPPPRPLHTFIRLKVGPVNIHFKRRPAKGMLRSMPSKALRK